MKRKILIIACILLAIPLFLCGAQTVDVADAASYIRSLTKDSKVVVKGELTDELLKGIAKAISEGENTVALDLSDTTGLTEWNVTVPVTFKGKKLEPTVFQSCANLLEIALPKTITKIGKLSFCGCRNLTSVTIPGSVTTIGDGVFRSCESLASIIIPDSVTTIGYGAFKYCESLEKITIPDSVTEIGNGAFKNCTSLLYVNASARVIQMVKNAMY